MRNIQYLIIHCADTPDDRDIDIAEVRRWHMKERKWADVGYHYFIKRNGVIEKGRSEDIAGAHTSGYNSISLGICLAGGIYPVQMKKANDLNNINHYTDAQIYSLKKLIDILLKRYPKAKVRGHRAFNSIKSCPNFNVKLLGYN